ncbi:energy transducer TonB [Tunturiibacter empetritectus]|uniref:TonB family protein n=1 Tax=Tunturiibacter lichenicola TaxID=2051959 RepID=A0A852VCH7_9BACT|nr:energy transducer TonB [Edaphobacter lichenicola]NYF89390.1 TonB family protein [Edaphobacter lichenicola]
MAFFSDSQETISHFGGSINELQDFFRISTVPYGEPDDFFAFARKLRKDIQLRTNLSVLAKSIMERESEISLRIFLTILAIASGGPDIATSEREISSPVNLIIDFLISIGSCSQISAEHPDSPCSTPTTDPAAIDHAGDFEALERVYVHPSLEAQSNTFAPTAIYDEEPSEELIPHSSFDSPLDPRHVASHDVNMLTESLSRLELNSLQVKFYLDSIDQRISRMEPRLENIPSLVLPAAPQPSGERVGSRLRDQSDAKFSATVPPTQQLSDPQTDQYPGESAQQVEATKETDINQATVAKEEIQLKIPQAKENPEVVTKPWMRFIHPLPSGKQYIFQIFLLGAALLLANLVYWRLVRDTTFAKSAPASEALPVAEALSPSSASSPDSPDQTQKPSVTLPTDAPGVNSQPTAQIDPSLNPKLPIITKPFDTNQPTHSNTSASLISTPTKSPDEVATDTASRAGGPPSAPRATTRWSPITISGRRVNVTSGVMAANLLSAPKPVYPKLASLTHTQGNVVMQAIISKRGTVENLRVIKGHHLLRGAATDAVRTWRFRPYIVDGVPVEVATIVSVDFVRH